MNGEFDNVPILLLRFRPFPKLSQFVTHEVQLFAWMDIHIEIHSTCLWKFAIVFSEHFLYNGCFSVYRFIV